MRSIYIPRGLVQEVDPAALGYASLDDLEAAYIPAALEGSTVDGKVYGLPSEFNVTALAINTAAFTEVGLDPAAHPRPGTKSPRRARSWWSERATPRRGFDFLYLHSGWYQNQLGTLMLQTGGRMWRRTRQ